MNPNASPNDLARSLRTFFSEYLLQTRGFSHHTVLSYRDSFALYIRFLAQLRGRPVVELDLCDIEPESVLAFLDNLESKRGNCASTRNARLAAIHAFARFVAQQHPEKIESCQRLLAVPPKKTTTRVVEYLEADEIHALLETADRTRQDGRRDYALMLLMFNTGARVQEIVDITPRDLQLDTPLQVRLVGKGRKERFCPLWPRTAEILKTFLAESGLEANATKPLFRNHCGRPLTRFGVRYILRKHARLGGAQAAGLSRKRVHPHAMRHSTAVHLLRSGVDLITISQWLGHASVETTTKYTVVDLETKRAALAKATPVVDDGTDFGAWRSDASILAWLEAL